VHPCTALCLVALDPASLPRHTSVLPCAPRLQTHVPAREGSSATTCRTTSDPASLLGRALVLTCVTQLWTLPPYSGGFWCCHRPHGSGPCLPAREGSSAAKCHTALNPAFLFGRAPVLPRAPWLWTLPPCSRGWGGGAPVLSHVSRPSEGHEP
jgi:hypothetical protein